MARTSVHGIGPARYVVGENAEGAWKLSAFPLYRRDVRISDLTSGGEIAKYVRGERPAVRFDDGEEFHFRKESPVKTVLESSASQTLFSLERVEFFPRWRFEMKLESGAPGIVHLPVLISAAGLLLMFPGR